MSPDASDALPRDLAELWRAIESMHVRSFAWARACASSSADASDVLQNVYEKVLSGRARFDGRSSVKRWLFGVIRLTALEHGRERRGTGREASAAEEPRTSSPPQEAAVTRARTARALVAALAELPERQRQVLHLVFYEELTVEAAAEAMGVSVGTARVHYDRGKKRLAVLIDESGVER